jgi:2-polyprenyl-3-methyl-5-hydroxy-6-metoxy-1,4-benzoquinol methylase
MPGKSSSSAARIPRQSSSEASIRRYALRPEALSLCPASTSAARLEYFGCNILAHVAAFKVHSPVADKRNNPFESAPSIEQQREYWNTWNTQYREGKIDAVSAKRAEAVFRLLDSLNLEKPRIIELGCGSGWLAADLSQRGPVTAIDVADEVIARAKERWPHIEFLAGDLFAMDLRHHHYDVVVTLETIAQVEDQPGFVKLAADLLVPDGHLILTVQNKYVFERMEGVSRSRPGHIRRWLTMGGLKNLLHPHFHVLQTYTVAPEGHLGLLRFVNSYRLDQMFRSLGLSSQLETLKCRLGFGQALVALARKRTPRSHRE